MSAPIPLSPEVTGAIVEAARLARGRELGEVHLVAGLLRIGAVRSALQAIRTDVERLDRLVAELLERAPLRPWYRLGIQTLDSTRRASALAAATGQRELSSTFLFATLAHSGSAEVLAALAASDFSLLHFRFHVAHPGASLDEPLPSSGPVRIVLHDDPFTTEAFVHDVLREELGREHETAVAITARVGREGRVELTTLDATDASARVERVRARARALSFPLRVSAIPAS